MLLFTYIHLQYRFRTIYEQCVRKSDTLFSPTVLLTRASSLYLKSISTFPFGIFKKTALIVHVPRTYSLGSPHIHIKRIYACARTADGFAPPHLNSHFNEGCVQCARASYHKIGKIFLSKSSFLLADSR